MASSLKRPRSQEADEAAEDDHGLVKLLHRRLGDVEKLVTHVKNLEDELAEARGKLDKAVTLLDQFRATSRVKHGDRNENPAPRREAIAVNGVNGQTPSREDHHARASHSPAKKSVAAASPSVHSTKSAGGGSASRPVSVGKSPADRGQDKSSKRSSEAKSNKAKGAMQREHVDLIAMIRSQSKPTKLDVALPSYIPLQHKRKPRSLVLSPAIDHLCATSALDGVVNFWQITQEKGFGVKMSHTVDCISPGQRRWPEDLAWHPHGETLFAVYTADGGPQIGIIKTSKAKSGVKFLDDKPHEKGIINTIEFLPWSNGSQFVTGGCDHGVVLWTEKEEGWQPRLLHRTLHSSAVTGVGGIPNKNYIISSGMDKRVFAVDPSHGRSTFQHQLESKALGVAPNPADYNLVMVQTGSVFFELVHLDSNYVCLIYGCKGRSCIVLGGSNKLAIHSLGTSVNPGPQMVCTVHQGPQIPRYMFLTLDTTAGNLSRLWMPIRRGSSRLHGIRTCRCCCPSLQTSSLECIKYFEEWPHIIGGQVRVP